VEPTLRRSVYVYSWRVRLIGTKAPFDYSATGNGGRNSVSAMCVASVKDLHDVSKNVESLIEIVSNAMNL
jgi:hypothetical protein